MSAAAVILLLLHASTAQDCKLFTFMHEPTTITILSSTVLTTALDLADFCNATKARFKLMYIRFMRRITASQSEKVF